MIFKLYFIVISTALFTFARSVPINRDAQTCMELCASCKGTATFADDKCECDIGENGKEGAECLRRMRRETGDSGFNLISCDVGDRNTRCTLGSKHFHTRNSIDQVAKYFMKNGPITGSIFKAPPYSVRSKIHDCEERPEVVSNANFAKAPQYSAPPQQVIINLPHGYTSNGSPMTGSGSPDGMTGSTHVIIQPKFAPGTPSDNVDSTHLITQPKELMPTDIVEAPQIITQPTELFPPVTTEYVQPDEPEQPEIDQIQSIEPAQHNVPEVKTQTFEINSPPLSRDYAAIRMVTLPKSVAPLFMQSLLQHLSQPMLGIPQAVQTLTKAPGISQIVSAPGNLLNSLVSRLASRGGDDSDSKSKGGDGDDDDSLKFTTNSQLFSHYDPDLYKLYVNPGDDFSTMLGSGNPYTMGVPSTPVLVHPSYVQSPMIGGCSPYDREYGSQIPSYIVGSPLGLPYFDSDETYIPIYADIPKMGNFINEPNDPKVGLTPAAKENNPAPKKDIIIEVPVLKSKKICKKSSNDESSKKITRDIKTIFESESISEEVMEATEKHQNQDGTTQETELPKIDRTTTQEPMIEKTSDQEREGGMTKMKIDKAKAKISSKIKRKSLGEKKSDANKK